MLALLASCREARAVVTAYYRITDHHTTNSQPQGQQASSKRNKSGSGSKKISTRRNESSQSKQSQVPSPSETHPASEPTLEISDGSPQMTLSSCASPKSETSRQTLTAPGAALTTTLCETCKPCNSTRYAPVRQARLRAALPSHGVSTAERRMHARLQRRWRKAGGTSA